MRKVKEQRKGNLRPLLKRTRRYRALFKFPANLKIPSVEEPLRNKKNQKEEKEIKVKKRKNRARSCFKVAFRINGMAPPSRQTTYEVQKKKKKKWRNAILVVSLVVSP